MWNSAFIETNAKKFSCFPKLLALRHFGKWRKLNETINILLFVIEILMIIFFNTLMRYNIEIFHRDNFTTASYSICSEELFIELI